MGTTAYGDESVKGRWASYALVAVDDEQIRNMEDAIRQASRDMGYGDSGFHCSVYMNEHRRRKLGVDKTVTDVVKDFVDLSALMAPHIKASIVGWVKFTDPPQQMDVFGDGKIIAFTDKICCGMAFKAAATKLLETENCSGLKIFPDKDTTKIEWFGSRSQAWRKLAFFREDERVNVNDYGEQQPVGIQVADLLAYAGSQIANGSKSQSWKSVFENYKAQTARVVLNP